MCFSEKASFTAAAALTVMTVVSFWTVRREKRFYALAAIPFFFALQQASEGVEWLVFKNLWGSPKEAESARNLFVLIAYVVWPFWIPFSLWLPEQNAKRKRLIEYTLLLGVLVSAYGAWKILFYPVSAYVIENSIYYEEATPRLWSWFYAITSILPWFFSSLPLTKWAGIVFWVGSAIAYYMYFVTYASVWCFVAAVLSLFLIFVLRASVKQQSRPDISRRLE